MQYEIIFSCLAASAITTIVTFTVAKKHYETISALDFERKKNAMIDETKKSTIAGIEFSAKLENEYFRGKEDGKNAELQNFTISYEPYQEVVEEYLGIKKRVELGYDMQLYYSGLPIGQSTRKTTHKNIEFDKETIEKILNSELMSTLNNVMQLIATKGMNAKILPTQSKKRT